VAELSRSFAVESNDMMLTLYLASLIRGITAMHDLIDNKAARMAVERDQVRAGAAGIWLAY
jgi:26S proteasome regulatory subunit N8